MKKWWWLGGLILAAILAVAYAVISAAFREEPTSWTTSSPRALEAFERGLASQAKFYGSEAAHHFTRAIELDGDFAAAKLQLLLTDGGSPEQREVLFRDLGEVDLAGLSAREIFLISYWRARFSGDSAEAKELLENYLLEAPEDPWAISTSCESSWEREAWDEAEACYRRLIDMHPNWVRAQNRLGLIAMARGLFSQAEEHFRTYTYIAPDQAAPWDSLGQLLAVRGHYAKAAEAYERALEIKPDYCFAHWHLAVLESLRRRFEISEQRLRELEAIPACADYVSWGLVCSRRAWNAYALDDLATARSLMDSSCLERRGGFDFVAHRLALADGDFAEGEQLEKALEHRLHEKREKGDVFVFYENFLRATGKHLVAMRLWSQSEELQMACKMLAEADSEMLYWGLDRAMFKLFNLRQLAVCEDALGRPENAVQARADLDAVNPRYRAEYDVPELPGFR